MPLGNKLYAQAIAARENFDHLADITTAGVREWVASSGLSAAEHARIQPSYCEPRCPDVDDYVCLEDGRSVAACYHRDCDKDSRIAHPGPCEDYDVDPERDCRPD